MSILKTLAYHDIFQYPLKAEEIRSYLISCRIKLPQLKRQISVLIKAGKIENHKDYYFLKGKKSTVATRISRLENSKIKFKKARFYANILKLVGTIQMVAVSGALAMENSHKNDDIDLVIVTAKGTLWTTRLITMVLLSPFKRNPGSKSTDNRACLNLFFDESDLNIKNQNIYQAHEICQMQPLWSRSKTYSRFIHVNKWIFNFLPNWTPISTVDLQFNNLTIIRLNDSKISQRSTGLHTKIIELFAKKLQLAYMRKKITTEKIGERQLFFHPKDTQGWVLDEYQKRLKENKLL